MRFKPISIAVSIVVAVMAVQRVPAAAKIEDYAFGLRLLEDGHLDAAILAFESYLENNPKGARRAEARFFLAETRHEKGVIAEALREYRTFLAENPEHPFRSTAHFRIGKIELGNGRLKAAAGQFSKVRDGPLIDQALYHLGHIQFRLEDWAAAIRAFSDLLGRFPSSPFSAGVRYVLGIAHYKGGQDTQALKNLQAYLKSPRPGKVESLWAHAVAGMIRKRQGVCDSAIRHFEVVLQADPRFPPRGSAAWGLAECLYEKKDYHSAAKIYAAYLETYAKSPQVTLARIRAGHSHFLAGRYQDALGYFRKLAKENVPPQYRQWVLYWTARSLDLSGDPDAALRGYEELIRSFPDGSATFDAAARAAAIRLRRKEYERAVEILSVLKGALDGLQAAWAVRMTGEAQFALGRFGEAYEAFREVLPKVQDKAVRREMIRKLGLSAFRIKKDRAALEHLGGWLRGEEKGRPDQKREPWPTRRYEVLKVLAAVQTRLGLLREVADTWTRLEAEAVRGVEGGTADGLTEFSANRGFVLFRLKEYASAERAFRNWLTRYPRDKRRPLILLHLGLAEIRTEKFADGVSHLDAFLKENPSHPRVRDALYASALGAMRMKDYASSARRLANWLAGAEEGGDAGRQKEAWFLLAAARFELAEWKLAAAAYHRILKGYPKDKRREAILLKLGVAYDRMAEVDGLDAVLGWVSAHAPEFRKGKLFLRLGKDRLRRRQWKRAAAYLRVAAQSEDPIVRAEGLFRLASANVRGGNQREALQAIEKIPRAVEESADWRADAEYLRGVVYEAERQWEKAVKAYRVAARQTSSPSVARAALDRIGRIESAKWKN